MRSLSDLRARVVRLVAGPLAAVTLSAVALTLLTGPATRPRLVPVAASDGGIGAQRLAFFSNHHPALYERMPNDVESYPRPLFSDTVDDQPSGRNNRLAYITYRSSGAGVAERDGDLAWWAVGDIAPHYLPADAFPDAEPDISPDGRRIVFASQRSGSWDIWVINTDGTGLRQLTDDAAVDAWPRFSPNGSRIAFSSTKDDPAGEIYTMPAAGGATTRLTNDPAADLQPSWSAAGDRLAFTTRRWQTGGDVAVMSAAGEATQLARIAPGSEPVWSPSGANDLTYVSHTDFPNGQIMTVRLGSAPKPLTSGQVSGWGERHPAWVNSTFLITTYDADVPAGVSWGTRSSDIWGIGLDGSGLTDLTRRPQATERAPAYSTDGRRLAYQDERGGVFGITVAAADGSGPVALTTPPAGASDVDPTWSPDGKWIAFARKRYVADPVTAVTRLVSEIRIVDASTGAQGATLPCGDPATGTTCADGEPAWSPDGKTIAFTRSTGPQQPTAAPSQPAGTPPPFEDNPVQRSHIWRVDVSAQLQFGTPRAVTTADPATGADQTDLGPAWSPDGQWLAFVSDGMFLVRVHPNGTGRQILLNAGWGSEVGISSLAGPAWSLDGSVIAFAAGPPPDAESAPTVSTSGNEWSDLYTIPSGGGTPELLYAAPGEDSQPVFQPSADLSLDMQATPAAVTLGGATTVRAAVTNHGWSTATNASVTLTVPTWLRPTAIRTSAGSCVLAQLRCTFGTLAVGQTATVTVDALGVMLGTVMLTASATANRFDPDESDNTARVSVFVGAAADVTVAVTAVPETGYLGGDPIVVTYTVTNRGSFDATGVVLAVDLPTELVASVEVSPPALGRGCDTPIRTCTLGTVLPTAIPGPVPSLVPNGVNAITVKVTIAAKAEINTIAGGKVSAANDSDLSNNSAGAPFRILAPAITVAPRVGEAGFVPRVTGVNFPPGGQLRLSWDYGITQQTPPIVVTADGTFTAPMMVFNRDVLGQRTLRATQLTGPKYAVVTTKYLVVPGAEQPDKWLYRR